MKTKSIRKSVPDSTVKLISPQEVLPLRSQILRSGAPEKECYFEGDTAKAAFHLGIVAHSDIVGIASFLPQTHPEFVIKNTFRLRGMAVHPTFQEQGLGSDLLIFGLQKLKKEHIQGLWFNSRSRAVDFYAKFGFKKRGNEFTIPNVGPHFLMTGEVK